MPWSVCYLLLARCEYDGQRSLLKRKIVFQVPLPPPHIISLRQPDIEPQDHPREDHPQRKQRDGAAHATRRAARKGDERSRVRHDGAGAVLAEPALGPEALGVRREVARVAVEDVGRDEDRRALVDDESVAESVGACSWFGRALEGGGDGGVQAEGFVAAWGRLSFSRSGEGRGGHVHDGVEVRETRELCRVDGLACAPRKGGVELGAEARVRGGVREDAVEGVAERDGSRV